MSDTKPSNPPLFEVDAAWSEDRQRLRVKAVLSADLRDLFAAAALAGYAANSVGFEARPDVRAKWSYADADAMLAEREK